MKIAISLILGVFLWVSRADKDDSFYITGTGNPNVNEAMYWKDSENVLQDLSSFSALYVEFHQCAWTWMQYDDEGNDVDENDYWYMGKIPPMGANVAFSLYGSLKGKSFTGCGKDTFINSFYTNSGFKDFAQAMAYAGVSGFSSYSYSDDDGSYSSSSSSLTSVCKGGYGVGCDYSNGFAVHTYSSNECDPDNVKGVKDNLSNLNQAMNKAQCVQIYDARYYSGYTEGTPLDLLYNSHACFYQDVFSPDGECPDPYGKLSYYQEKFHTGIQESRSRDPYQVYNTQREYMVKIQHGKSMANVGAALLAIAAILFLLNENFLCKLADKTSHPQDGANLGDKAGPGSKRKRHARSNLAEDDATADYSVEPGDGNDGSIAPQESYVYLSPSIDVLGNRLSPASGTNVSAEHDSPSSTADISQAGKYRETSLGRVDDIHTSPLAATADLVEAGLSVPEPEQEIDVGFGRITGIQTFPSSATTDHADGNVTAPRSKKNTFFSRTVGAILGREIAAEAKDKDPAQKTIVNGSAPDDTFIEAGDVSVRALEKEKDIDLAPSNLSVSDDEQTPLPETKLITQRNVTTDDSAPADDFALADSTDAAACKTEKDNILTADYQSVSDDEEAPMTETQSTLPSNVIIDSAPVDDIAETGEVGVAAASTTVERVAYPAPSILSFSDDEEEDASAPTTETQNITQRNITNDDSAPVDDIADAGGINAPAFAMEEEAYLAPSNLSVSDDEEAPVTAATDWNNEASAAEPDWEVASRSFDSFHETEVTAAQGDVAVEDKVSSEATTDSTEKEGGSVPEAVPESAIPPVAAEADGTSTAALHVKNEAVMSRSSESIGSEKAPACETNDAALSNAVNEDSPATDSETGAEAVHVSAPERGGESTQESINAAAQDAVPTEAASDTGDEETSKPETDVAGTVKGDEIPKGGSRSLSVAELPEEEEIVNTSPSSKSTSAEETTSPETEDATQENIATNESSAAVAGAVVEADDGSKTPRDEQFEEQG